MSNIQKKEASFRVVLAHLQNAPIPGMAPEQARVLKEGAQLMEQVSKNISQGAKPLEGIDEDQQKALLAYTVIRRENPILEKNHHVNYEGAVNVLENPAFEEGHTTEERLAKQLNKLDATKFPLTYEKGKGIIVNKSKD